MKNLSISLKLIIGFGIVLALLVASAVVALVMATSPPWSAC